jgi:hypothetical protein
MMDFSEPKQRKESAMTNANDVAKTLAKKKLGEYSTEQTKPVVAREVRQHFPRKTTVKSSPKPVTSAKDYATRYPSIQTPSVLSKAKVDVKLKAMQELPWPKETAVYKRADFEKLVGVLADYMLDVTEGAGLINAGTAGTALRDALASVIPDHFKHRDPFDGEYRVISVEDK